MAEPVDYFMQGVGLGQRSRSIRNQEDQFRTNLAERARQFDLSNDIAQSNLELRQKEFTLNQENAVIENQYRIANTERIKAANNQAKKLADDAVKFAPAINKFQTSLNDWDGVSAPPDIPANLPKAQRAEAIAMRNDAINASNTDEQVKLQRDWNAQQAKLYNEGFAWMMQNNPRGLMYNAETNEAYYDFNSYLKMRESQTIMQNRMRVFGPTGMTPSSATYYDKASGIQTTFKPQARPVTTAEERKAFLKENITKFQDADGVIDYDQLEAAMSSIFGTPVPRASVTDPSQINPADLLGGDTSTTP